MSRTVSHAVKQASLNLRDMVDKKQIGLESEDITEFINGKVNRNWDQDSTKPEIVETLIEQAKALFNIGSEAKSWSCDFYHPDNSGAKGGSLSIPPLKEKMGARFIVVVGTREIANLSASVSKTDAESPMMMLSGDCLYLKVTVGPVLSIGFNNVNAEKMAPRKGFRETVVRKNWQNRYVFVINAHVETSDVVSHVTKSLLKGKTETNSSSSDLVADLASKMDDDEIPELVGE